jgi:hygromycin-B 7''-O-kinase
VYRASFTAGRFSVRPEGTRFSVCSICGRTTLILERPIFISHEDYGPRFTDPVFWRPYVAAICARHELGPCDELRAGLPGTNPVFIVDETYAVKLYTNLFNGAASYPIERATYELIARAPGLPAPALIATGDLFDPAGGWPWPYIVTQAIPGQSLGESQVSYADRLALAAWLGPVVHAIHDLPLDDAEPLRPVWDNFAAFLAAQHAAASATHARWGRLPARLVAQIDGYLPSMDELIDRSEPPALIHGDLNRDHVLGETVDGAWQPTGIIDFGDVWIGDRMYELVALHLGLFDADRRLLRAFLDAYGFDDRLRRDFVRRAMAMTLLFQFDTLGEVIESMPVAAQAASLGDLAELLWGQ